MARRLNWAKAGLAKKPKLSLSGEQEYLAKGFTARWLEQAEKRATLHKRQKFKRLCQRLKY